MKKILLFLLLFNIHCLICQEVLQISPQQTDSTIDNWLSYHIVYLTDADSVPQKLFLYLPGTNGNPAEAQYILKLAAREGYNAIGLSYPNDIEINVNCSESTDSLCYENMRMEIIYGVDLTYEINVNMSNSLNNRLIRLLLYLNELNPDKGWNSFLTPDENVDWLKIILSGHSQGGGHAAMIAKFNQVSRLVMFSAPTDYSEYYGMPAFWLEDSFLTNTTSMYAFAHQQDGINRFSRIWNSMGLDQFGSTIDVDINPYPFENSHLLTTNVMPASGGSYHNSIILDEDTPNDSSGLPIFLDVWKYMSFYDQPIFVDSNNPSHNKKFILYPNYPNPFNPSTKIKYSVPEYEYVTLAIYNILGEHIITLINDYIQPGIFEATWNGKNSNRENVSSGIYLYKMTAGNFTQINKMIFLK